MWQVAIILCLYLSALFGTIYIMHLALYTLCSYGNMLHPLQELKGKEDNIYRGQNNYTKYIEGKETSQGSAASRWVWSIP